jgi:hypothetical protein
LTIGWPASWHEVEAELGERVRVRPFDALVAIEHDDAVRNGFGSLPEARDDVVQIALVRLVHAHAPVDRREDLGPLERPSGNLVLQSPAAQSYTRCAL